MMFLHTRFRRNERDRECFEFGTRVAPLSCLARTVSHNVPLLRVYCVSTQKQICRYLLVTYFVSYTP